jgi:hypothetical protein
MDERGKVKMKGEGVKVLRTKASTEVIPCVLIRCTRDGRWSQKVICEEAKFLLLSNGSCSLINL